jgi:hypothetical protein
MLGIEGEDAALSTKLPANLKMPDFDKLKKHSELKFALIWMVEVVAGPNYAT